MLTCLLCRHFVLVVVEVFPAVQKAELRVALLLGFRHLLEVGAISCDKLGEFIDYVA